MKQQASPADRQGVHTVLASQPRTQRKERHGSAHRIETSRIEWEQVSKTVMVLRFLLIMTGSFGNLSSAIVCAASAFSLTITDPAPFIADMDLDFFNNRYRRISSSSASTELIYAEPDLEAYNSHSNHLTLTPSKQEAHKSDPFPIIKSRIIALGSNIDTDALSPGSTLGVCETDAEFGEHCLEHTHPKFRQQVKDSPYNGSAVVIAGNGFGIGSSRESAVSALKGCGVVCVIAKSFAFIFGRNLPSLGLMGFNMPVHSEFWDVAWGGEGGVGEGREIEVDVEGRVVRVDVEGEWSSWGFELSEIEFQLTVNRGVTESFKRYGKRIWGEMMGKDDGQKDGAGGTKARATQHTAEVAGLEEDVNEIEKKMAW